MPRGLSYCIFNLMHPFYLVMERYQYKNDFFFLHIRKYKKKLEEI